MRVTAQGTRGVSALVEMENLVHDFPFAVNLKQCEHIGEALTHGREPDVVMACAGDVPTQEALAATALRTEFPDLKIRFINVVDLFKIQSDRDHPHGTQ